MSHHDEFESRDAYPASSRRQCTFVGALGQCTLLENHEGEKHRFKPTATPVQQEGTGIGGHPDRAAYQGGGSNRLTDLLALTHVPRWGIVSMLRPQSVGEHTFRVLVLYTELANRLNAGINTAGLLLVLHHDADESRTGDIPASVKDFVAIGSPVKFCPWIGPWEEASRADETHVAIAYLADQIEALTWIHKYGTGAHAVRVTAAMSAKLRAITPPGWWGTVSRLIEEVLTDEGR